MHNVAGTRRKRLTQRSYPFPCLAQKHKATSCWGRGGRKQKQRICKIHKLSPSPGEYFFTVTVLGHELAGPVSAHLLTYPPGRPFWGPRCRRTCPRQEAATRRCSSVHLPNATHTPDDSRVYPQSTEGAECQLCVRLCATPFVGFMTSIFPSPCQVNIIVITIYQGNGSQSS